VVAELKVEQLLHGYRSGHSQLAASIRLPPRDSELVTRLSDLSGSLSSGLKLDSYLTAYPLPSRTYFALARTWPDPEAPRAGCVLTHTILIPLDEWARIKHVRRFDKMFRNPRRDPNYKYDKPVDPSSQLSHATESASLTDLTGARTFVSRYFGKSVRPIVWFGIERPEDHLWSLLEHLWPNLRRMFASCTFSLQQRTLEDRPFDLLFAPSSVYSRFTKLSGEHIIEPLLERHRPEQSSEEWCDYWAQAMFSNEVGYPAGEDELEVWAELSDEPSAIRKLSLVHELRLRSSQSPTAGVGAIDVVESLARNPETALPLKREVLSDAINAAINSPSTEDAITTLGLIDDRLGREAFRPVSEKFRAQVSAAARRLTMLEPDIAIAASGTRLNDPVRDGDRSAFVNGVFSGLISLAETDPDQLTILKDHPELTNNLFEVMPSFAPVFLRVGGNEASRTVADWLLKSSDHESIRTTRRAIISTISKSSQEHLLYALLRDLPKPDIRETLGTLYERTNGFQGQAIRNVVADRLSSVNPQEVRAWASKINDWTDGLAQVVSTTYPQTKYGLELLLDSQEFSGEQKAEILVPMLRDQLSGGASYWLKDLVATDIRIIETLISWPQNSSKAREATLSKLLSEVSNIPIAQSSELLKAVMSFEERPVFDQLFDCAIRSAIRMYIGDSQNRPYLQSLMELHSAEKWFQRVPNSELAPLIYQESHQKPQSAARGWQWLASAPSIVYRRKPTLLLDLCDALLACVRQFMPGTVPSCMVHILKRSRSEDDDIGVHQELSGKLLKFSLDNTRFPLSSVVAEAFSDVYALMVQTSRRPSLFLSFLSTYEWDKGKELRATLVDTFWGSDWPPGDLAIAASRADILPKVFKRLHRRSSGDAYLTKMLRDLENRGDVHAENVATHLRTLIFNPDFYEEWD
jgi:hypothetical protein